MGDSKNIYPSSAWLASAASLAVGEVGSRLSFSGFVWIPSSIKMDY